jgi:hypothetical protein
MISETIYPKPEPTDIADCLKFVVPEHLCVGGAAEPFLYGGSGFAACVAAMEYFTGLPAIFASAQFTGKGRNDGQILGRSPWLQSVHVAGPDHLIGQLHSVRIIGTMPNSLTGELVMAS